MKTMLLSDEDKVWLIQSVGYKLTFAIDLFLIALNVLVYLAFALTLFVFIPMVAGLAFNHIVGVQEGAEKTWGTGGLVVVVPCFLYVITYMRWKKYREDFPLQDKTLQDK